MGQEAEVEALRRELAETKRLQQEQAQQLKELQEVLGRPEVKSLLKKTGNGKDTFYGTSRNNRPAGAPDSRVPRPKGIGNGLLLTCLGCWYGSPADGRGWLEFKFEFLNEAGKRLFEFEGKGVNTHGSATNWGCSPAQ